MEAAELDSRIIALTTFDDDLEPIEPLSDRELEIVRLVATGASNKEIALKLVLAKGTVKNHLTNILSKLGVRDRIQAALKSIELGLL